jgi:hypothetical protein
MGIWKRSKRAKAHNRTNGTQMMRWRDASENSMTAPLDGVPRSLDGWTATE